MYKKFIWLGVFFTFLLCSTLCQAVTVLYDDFSVTHDYLTSGVSGTVWDGVINGQYGSATFSDFNSNGINYPGQLFIDSSGGNWEGGADLGPFLYKNVTGDFEITTYVSDFPSTYWNTVGIMVRNAPDPATAGDSEQMLHFQVINSCLMQWTLAPSSTGEANAGALSPYLRIRKEGDLFYHERSLDGTTWILPGASPRSRPEMDGISLQVGLMQCNYVGDENAWAAFDYAIITGRAEGQAWNPTPANFSTGQSVCGQLSWTPGEFAQVPQGHEVYISKNLSDIEPRNAGIKVTVDSNSHYPGALALDTQYYWAVDEVNDACSPYIWPGDTWTFTTHDGKSANPDPQDGQLGIAPTIPTLSWDPAPCATQQKFFFGTVEQDVNDATVPNSILAGTASTVGVPMALQPSTPYYWRIDTDISPEGGPTTVKGTVWSFTTRVATPIAVCDDFEIFHDYWAGTEGTIWDGIIGQDFMLVMTANGGTYPGQLEITSGSTYWGGQDQGILLYKETVGRFIAEVQVTTPSDQYLQWHNWTGIMARVPNIEDAGPGEDWIQSTYFPLWNGNRGDLQGWLDTTAGGYYGRVGNTGESAGRYLQLEHAGDGVFYERYSTDGITWNTLNESDIPWYGTPETIINPTLRPDMAGLPLQVGLSHGTYSGTAMSAVFDNFCLRREFISKAFAPRPSDGGELDLMDPVLSWSPGDYAVVHHLYFSADFNDVNERKPAADKGTTVDGPDADGRFSWNAGGESLAIGNTYYWCIDEMNDPCLWPGDVWEFVVQDYTNIDTFETYTGTGKTKPYVAGTLWCVWVDGLSAFSFPAIPGTSGSHVQLNNDTYDGKPTYLHYVPDDEDIALTGSKSMKFYYDNDGTVNYDTPLYNMTPEFAYNYTPNPLKYVSEAYAAIDAAAADLGRCNLGMKRDWSGYKLLRVPFYGDPNNNVTNAAMYVGIQDGTGRYVYLSHPDATRLQKPWWQDWYVPLLAFKAADPLLDLTNIAKIYIGFGNRANPTLSPGGSGVVFFDNLQLLAYGICIPGSVVGDFDGDCTVNNNDLWTVTDHWLGEMPTLGTPIINLDASGLAVTPSLNSWANTGTALGVFDDFNNLDPNDNPSVAVVEGKKAVVFDGGDLLIWKDFVGGNRKMAPATLTSDQNEPNDFIIIAEVLNEELANEEYYFAWARNGGDATCASFGFGSSPAFGAVAHWGWTDMGFGPETGRYDNPAPHVWQTIAIVYDGTAESVIAGGIIRETEAKELLIYQNNPVTVGCRYDYNTGTLALTPSFPLTGAVASVKVYASSVPPEDLAVYLDTPVDLRSDDNIDFKDIAVLGNNWLIGPVLLGD